MKPRAASLRVLVADDSSPVRERMVSLLKELSCVRTVAESMDVPSTIECVCRFLPHVVILDISMPGGCGLDVLEFISAERIPSLVVVVTNFADPEYEDQARKAGADAFFDKSRDFHKAVEFVRELDGREPASPPARRLPAPPRATCISVPNTTILMNSKPEHEETLDILRSTRDTIRDLAHRAEIQNTAFHLSSDDGFLSPIPEEFNEELDRLDAQGESPASMHIVDRLLKPLPVQEPLDPEG
jgi:DNA-binding NarL/FixJ family response regulator